MGTFRNRHPINKINCRHGLVDRLDNIRRTKEIEAQVEAQQILIIEIFLVGKKTNTSIGMGIPAAWITSILRSWYPKNLLGLNVIIV